MAMNTPSMSLLELQTLSTALTQFVENQPELDEDETLADVVGQETADQVEAAEQMLEIVNLEIVQRTAHGRASPKDKVDP